MPLTDAACKNARCPADSPYKRFSDSGGLYLEVTKTGAKCWRWKYRFDGKEKRLSLGLYPAVGLAEARRGRDRAREVLSSGTDPSAAKKEAKRAPAINADTTFERVARAWWAHWSPTKSERYATYVLTRLEADAFPQIGPRPVDELGAQDFVRMVRQIESRGAGEIARRVWQTCGQVMRYAVANGIATRNPVPEVEPRDVLQAREATNFARVSAADLPDLMQKIMAYEGSTITRMGLQLMALTFVRTGELIGARWGEFHLDDAEWHIPASRMKMRRPHIVPLSAQALEVLGYLRAARGADRCKGEALLFPGERDHEKPISNNTLLFALYRMGYRGRMTGHGFRGLAATALMEMGYPEDLVKTSLAHGKENKVWGAYNHAQYIEERRDMMQTWADYLDAVKRGGKVIPFRRGRLAAAA